jgi:hypothetical protein
MKITIDDIWNLTGPEAEFIRGYLECALWSSLDDNGLPFDYSYDLSDISEKSIKDAINQCLDFQHVYRELFSDAYKAEEYGPKQAGHDFWLTRNGHGAGFWDRGLESTGDQLSSACGFQTGFYEVHLYIGDDGKICFE